MLGVLLWWLVCREWVVGYVLVVLVVSVSGIVWFLVLGECSLSFVFSFDWLLVFLLVLCFMLCFLHTFLFAAFIACFGF